MWDLLEKQKNLELLPRLVRLAQTLPTSSAPLEQSFSIIKLLKTDLRNSLTEGSLEGLILVGDEYREQEDILVTEKMLHYYYQVKKTFNETKNSFSKGDQMNIEADSNLQTIKNEIPSDKVVEELSHILEESFRIEEESKIEIKTEKIEEENLILGKKLDWFEEEYMVTQILGKRTPAFEISQENEEPIMEKKVKIDKV